MKLKRILSCVLIVSLLCSVLSGCGISSQHVEMHYEDNDNSNIIDWGDNDNNNVSDWDNVNVVSWNDVDEYSDWVYSQILFDGITDEYPVVVSQVLDYRDNGQYFDGDKIYQMVGDKFDVNSFIAKYAVGTGVIIIGAVFNVIINGVPKTIVCFLTGAANIATSQIRGQAFGAGISAVITAIKSEGNLEDTFYGALEGSADGYMWAAIYGTLSGEYSKSFCFPGDTLVQTSNGCTQIKNIAVGDNVLSYDSISGIYEYKPVSQIIIGSTDTLTAITVKGETIESTPSHPYFTDSGWKSAEDIVPLDRILSCEGEYVDVIGVRTVPCQDTVTYSLCVDSFHSFAVGNTGLVVHNRCNINGDYAGKNYQLKDEELAKKYPDGVNFTDEGFPDFSPYAIETVKFDPPSIEAKNAGTCLTGVDGHDFSMANKALGFKDTPAGYTWNHKEDMMTLELIPTDLHMAVRHTGGASLLKALFKALG